MGNFLFGGNGMNNKVNICLFIVLGFLFLSHPIFAGRGLRGVNITDKTGKQVVMYDGSYALLIGVSNYTAGWPDLESVPGEIQELESVLTKKGFHVETVMDPNYNQLKSAYEDFINKYGLDEDNRLLFYYSGHGHTRKAGKKGYLVPVDAPDPQDDDKGFVRKALNMNQILTWARNIEAKHALFMFDSCFSGTIFKSRAKPVPKHISNLTSRPVRQFITAGSAGEEVPSKSIFTPSFIRGLEGEADIDLDGYITGTELGLYLYKKVLYYDSGQTPQYGKIKDPELDEGDFVFILSDKSDAYGNATLDLPPETEDLAGLDFEKIQQRRNKRYEDQKLLTAVKSKWTVWQQKLESVYNEAVKYDKDAYLKANEKVDIWQHILTGFKQNNPYSTKDESMLNIAQKRVEYWENSNQRVRKPAMAIQKQPSSRLSNIKKPIVNLRSYYKNFTLSQVKSVPYMSIHKRTNDGFYGHSTITHDYEAKTIGVDRVVIDNATGLLWHQSGATDYITWTEAKEWVKELNQHGYAGYNDWRLPTLEEAVSLLESNKKNGKLYIDGVFDKKQKWIWTGDKKSGSDGAWYVYYSNGFVSWKDYLHFVRPVRSVK